MTCRKQHGVVELAAKVAGPCRLVVPVCRILRAAAAPPTFLQTAGNQVHRPSVALGCGLQKPAQSLRLVRRNPAAVEQEVAEVVLPPVVAALGRSTIARRGCFQVHRDTPAALVAATHHVRCLGVSLGRSACEPTECGLRVRPYAGALEQHSPEAHLRGRHAAFGGATNPSGRLDRIAGKQRMQ